MIGAASRKTAIFAMDFRSERLIFKRSGNISYFASVVLRLQSRSSWIMLLCRAELIVEQDFATEGSMEKAQFEF